MSDAGTPSRAAAPEPPPRSPERGPGEGEPTVHSILDAVEAVFDQAGSIPEPPERVPAPPARAPGRATSAPRTSEVSTPSGPARTGRDLGDPDATVRRQALARIEAAGASSTDLEALAQTLVSDPDPGLRVMAARALGAAGAPVPYAVLARAIQDPDDAVRAAVVRLAAAAGPSAMPLLAPLLAARAWPLAQQAALRLLPDLLGGTRPHTMGLEAVFAAVAALDPPPLPAERPALGALARAIGTLRLAGELRGPEFRRLGAARLLLAEGGEESLRTVGALANDPTESLRRLARAAGAMMPDVGAGPDGEAQPAPPAVTLPGEGSSELILALGRALADPNEAVAAKARSALSSLPEEPVSGWVQRTLLRGDVGQAAVAADVARAVPAMRSPAAGALLARAAAAPLDDRGPYLRALAAMAPGPEALAALAQAAEPRLRPEAVRLTWQLGGQGVLAFLVPMLDDSAGAVRMAVLEVYVDSADPAAARLARELLVQDSSAAVRVSAARAMARLGGPDRLEAMRLALSDPDPDVRAIAVEALPLRPDPTERAAVGSLMLEALADPDDRVSSAAADRLGGLAATDPRAAWRGVRESSEPRREQILRSIERVDRSSLAPMALASLGSTDPAERALAVDVAARAGTPECVAAVIDALLDPEPYVRRTAASAMAALRTPGAVQALARCLVDPQADVRVHAIHSVGLIDDDEVPSVLIEALKDPEVRVRRTAADGLLRWRSPAVARRLAAALASPDLRQAAGEILERMGSVSVEPLVEAVVAAPEPEAATAAGSVLERLVGPEPFVARLGSTDPDARLRAVEVLGAIGDREAADALLTALGDPDVRVRTRAASLLGVLGGAEAARALKRVFLSDPVVEVANAAEAALRALEARMPSPEGQQAWNEQTVDFGDGADDKGGGGDGPEHDWGPG